MSKRRTFLKWAAITVGVLLLLVGGLVGWMAATLSPNLEVGAPSPAVTFTALDGQPLPLASLRGKFVLLDFWGST